VSDIGFPEDDLPSPMSQRRRVAASDRAGGVPPPPPRPAARLTPVPTPPVEREEPEPDPEPEVGEQDERTGEQEDQATAAVAGRGPEPDAPAGGARTKRRSRQAEAQPSPAPSPAAVTGYADINVQLPRSIAEALEADTRSRPMVFRDAFEAHVEEVVANAPRRPAPKVLGMERPRERRRADPNDPFVEILFRMRPNEKAVWLEWVAKTDLSSSAFATEMLRLEYSHTSH
jgi:hypothetical protein